MIVAPGGAALGCHHGGVQWCDLITDLQTRFSSTSHYRLWEGSGEGRDGNGKRTWLPHHRLHRCCSVCYYNQLRRRSGGVMEDEVIQWRQWSHHPGCPEGWCGGRFERNLCAKFDRLFNLIVVLIKLWIVVIELAFSCKYSHCLHSPTYFDDLAYVVMWLGVHVDGDSPKVAIIIEALPFRIYFCICESTHRWLWLKIWLVLSFLAITARRFKSGLNLP
jgi:hypothetical protein